MLYKLSGSSNLFISIHKSTQRQLLIIGQIIGHQLESHGYLWWVGFFTDSWHSKVALRQLIPALVRRLEAERLGTLRYDTTEDFPEDSAGFSSQLIGVGLDPIL